MRIPKLVFSVDGDDGQKHIEYDLLVTNVFTGPVTLSSVEVLDESSKVLLRMTGDQLANATQTLLEQKPLKVIPPSFGVVVEVDLIIPESTEAPTRLSHRVSYEISSTDPRASAIEGRAVVGPSVAVNPFKPVVVKPPLSGANWASLNGCCTPNIHRNTRIGVPTALLNRRYLRLTGCG